mmetsp:Transcript_106221/g.167733  ORF Transcript_106221/g.167733 Transcript_106221/m.167733 type:complete len:192 (+) Transcript_106221:60-635(+)|eukprot:CAMPEP_0169117714 /NCGR_PEP_ID=MMETSP1015-20121227/30611_1 /TAXON_ID=342587 /ORGANISM="Karlodinium micrum, Strain CCMP2283" /LENGTH=191 /DNA_ID=CAMNT_0009180427 /DNA_START=61 /DNA_END=636 /DNA_ORIENTATION=+
MAKFLFALACLACGCHGRRTRSPLDEVKEHSPSMSRLGEFLLASGPRGAFARTSRYASPKMSHFSNIKTKFLDKVMLAKSLRDLGYDAVEADGDRTLPVRGYQGAEEEAQIVVEQDNNHDIGFKFNGKEFELVSDLDFWQASMPVNKFLETLSKRYAINTILNRAEAENFNVANLEEDATGKVTMKLQRFA